MGGELLYSDTQVQDAGEPENKGVLTWNGKPNLALRYFRVTVCSAIIQTRLRRD